MVLSSESPKALRDDSKSNGVFFWFEPLCFLASLLVVAFRDRLKFFESRQGGRW